MYGYNPYGNSIPVMQNRLEQQQYQYRPPMQQPLMGRVVTGIDEARASQIALDGSVSYFPSPAEGKIYAKSIDMQGLPVFLTYELCTNQNAKIVENNQKSDLVQRLEALEAKVKELTKNESVSVVE